MRPALESQAMAPSLRTGLSALEDEERVWTLMASFTSIKMHLILRPQEGGPDILFWSRKWQVDRAEAMQKLKADLEKRKNKVNVH